MIIPAVFAFSGGDKSILESGPGLMFITLPKVFADMGITALIGIMFFALVFFAAITSAIALMESAVSTFEDELHVNRKVGTLIMAGIMLVLGSLSSLGYGLLGNVKIFGIQFLDFFDFITNSVMMPIAAIITCIYCLKAVGLKKIEQEVLKSGGSFKRKAVFEFMIKYLCIFFLLIILISSVANVLGIIKM